MRRTPRTSYFRIGADEFIVATMPLVADTRVAALSDAEKVVVELALTGRSNAEIARVRRRSARTIANQMRSALRKLGVTSRIELAVLCARQARAI